MILSKQQLRRSNKVLYCVIILLDFFYFASLVELMRANMTPMSTVFLAFIVLTAVVSSVANFRFPEGQYNLYIETLLYFVTYAVSLMVFPHYFYYTYMFAIMFVIVMFFNKKFLIVMAVLTEIVNVFIVTNYKVALPFEEYHGYVIAMILIMFLSFYTGLNLIVRVMKENQDAIMETSNKNEEIAKRVVTSVTTINEQFDTIMDELKEINERSETSNSAMKTIAESTERTAGEITAQENMTLDIQNAITTTLENVETVQNTTAEVLGVIEGGIDMVQNLDSTSQKVNQNTSQMSEIIEILVKRVADVSDITKAILSISSQTNLLALNASIEAARAGEAGKGFAVVADEIRNLADETKQSTEKITEIITELEQVTDNTMRMLEESVGSIKEQNVKIGEVNQSFQSGGKHMEQLRQFINGIVDDVNTIKESNDKIVISVQELSTSTDEVSDRSQESAASSEQIMTKIEEFTRQIELVQKELADLSSNI